MTKIDRDGLSWNFFRRRHEPELWCAVLADDAVPRFLLSGEWQYSGQHFDRKQPPPPGFDSDVAVESERLNGFYLFQLTQRPHLGLYPHAR